ncbi:MAG: TerC family protein [Verrucomicrobiota bacterium]
MTLEFLLPLAQIMMVNIVLSGDNAVVIAMAARSLPPRQQRRAILWGCGGAVVLRVILTLVAAALFNVTLLKCVGGLLLVWIACKLLAGEDQAPGAGPHLQGNLLGAIKTILVADVVMSLDNTLAIAAVAKNNYLLLVLGLLLSIPIVVFGSTLIMKLMDRFPIIVYLGGGLIAYTAGSMIDDDRALQPYLPHILRATPWLLPAILTMAVMAYGRWHNTRRGRSARDVLAANQHAAQRVEDQID